MKNLDVNNLLLDEVDDIKDEIYDLYDEEYCCMENIPENLQYSDRYEEAQEASDCLYDASDAIDELCAADEDDDIKEMIYDIIELLGKATGFSIKITRDEYLNLCEQRYGKKG